VSGGQYDARIHIDKVKIARLAATSRIDLR